MTSPARLPRNMLIALSVVLLHGAALWALQTGLLRRIAEEIVPAEILSEWIEPITAKPEFRPASPAASSKPPPTRQSQAEQAAQKTLQLTPAQEVAPASVMQSTTAPIASIAMASPPPTLSTASEPTRSTSSPAMPSAPPAPPRLELPSSDAQYLQNPKPIYPGMSKRLGEQGKVVVRVLIGVDGKADKTEIQQSSGFERLDQAALSTVSAWRFVPGKRGGVPEAMWFNVPINFVLE